MPQMKLQYSIVLLGNSKLTLLHNRLLLWKRYY